MRPLLPLLIIFLLSSLPAQSRGETEKLQAALTRAQQELATLKTENRKAAARRDRERDRLLEVILGLEKQTETLSAGITSLQATNKQYELKVTNGAGELKTLEKANKNLTSTIRQGARAILSRTANSLAGLGDQDFQDSRQAVITKLAADPPGANETILQAALHLAQLELNAGYCISRISAEIPDSAGRPVKAQLLRVGLLGAAGKQGIVVPEAEGEGFRLARPGGLFSGRKIKSALKDLSPLPAPDQATALPLDVTGGMALAALAAEKGFLDSLAAGGLVMVPIGAVGLMGILIALYRGLALMRERRLLKGLQEQLPDLVNRGEIITATSLCKKGKGTVGHTLASCLGALRQAPTQADRILDQALLQGALGLERFLATLGVLGTLAPFLGLLGTVTGMIRTFTALTTSGAKDSSVLAGGIAEALVTTECGLIVAIPLVLLHSLLSGQAERIGADLEEVAANLAGEKKEVA